MSVDAICAARASPHLAQHAPGGLDARVAAEAALVSQWVAAAQAPTWRTSARCPYREDRDRARRRHLGAHHLGAPADLGFLFGEQGQKLPLLRDDRRPQLGRDGVPRAVPQALAIGG